MGRAICFALVLAFPLSAGEREDNYMKHMCLPLVREFIERNHISYDPHFPTNQISHHQVEYHRESGIYLSRLMLEKKHAFLFVGNQKTNGITIYSDKTSAWKPSLMDPKNEEKMRVVSSRTNHLNDQTALALARHYFRLQGHDEKNFHPVKFEQEIWARDVASRRIVLPFYHAEWVRMDTPKEDYSRMVTITVSGTESNLVHYSKGGLPIEFGHDWETRTNRGTAYPTR